MTLRLQTYGLRSTDRAVALNRLNLLLGPVGAGKSSLLDAIRFVALGYVPVLGKSEAATARLMRGDEIAVAFELGEGRTIQRKLIRDGAKFRGEYRASWLPRKSKDTEHGEAIRKLFGGSELEAAEHLDLRTLLSCSANERAKRIEQLLDASALPPNDVSRRGAALMLLRLADVDPKRMPAGVDEAEEVAAGCAKMIDAAVLPFVRQVEVTLAAKLLQDGIAKTAEEVKQKKLDAAEDARRKVAARGEIEDRAVGLRAPADALADLESRKAAASDALSRANQDLDTHAKTSTARANAESALRVIREQEETTVRTLDLAKAGLPRAAELRAKAEAIQDPPDVVAPAAVEPDAGKVAESDRLHAEARDLEEKLNALPPLPEPIDLYVPDMQIREAETRLRLAESNPWREVEAIADEMGRDKLVVWAKRLRKLAKDHGGDVEDLRTNLTRMRTMLRELEGKAKEQAAQTEKMKADVEALRQKAKELRDRAFETRRLADFEAAEANRGATATYRGAMADRAVIVDRNARERRALLDEATKLEREPVAQQMALDKLTASRKEQEGIIAGTQAAAIDVAATTSLVAHSKALIAELNEKIAAARQADARRVEMNALLAEIAKATALRDAYAAALWACERLREEDLAARSKGLEARMRTFLRAAGRMEDPYLRAARGVCEFGWRRGEYEIAVEALSGGETVLFCAALAAAVIALRGPELKLLLIEAAELGAGETAQSVLKGCEAVAEWFDVVAVATCATIEPPAAWNVVAVPAAPSEGVAAA